MRILTYIVIIFSSCFFQVDTHAQCCAQGTPMGGAGNLGLMKRGKTQIVSFYKFSQSVSQNEVNPYNITGADFNFIGSAVSFGLTQKITTELELGYFLNKSHYYKIGDVDYEVRGSGFANGFLTLKYGLIGSPTSKWELVGGLGVKFPFSANYAMQNNVQLPVDNQPSTCAFGVAAKVLLYRKFPEKGLNLFIQHRTDFNFANKYDYTYGHGFTTSFFAAKKLDFISCNALGVLQIRHDYRMKDKKQDGTYIDVTGSNTFFISPQFGWTFYKKYFLSVMYDVPLYQKFNTEKLKYKQAFTVSFVANLGK